MLCCLRPFAFACRFGFALALRRFAVASSAIGKSTDGGSSSLDAREGGAVLPVLQLLGPSPPFFEAAESTELLREVCLAFISEATTSTGTMPPRDTKGVSGSQFPFASRFIEPLDLSRGTGGMNVGISSAGLASRSCCSSCRPRICSLPEGHAAASIFFVPTLPRVVHRVERGGRLCPCVSAGGGGCASANPSGCAAASGDVSGCGVASGNGWVVSAG